MAFGGDVNLLCMVGGDFNVILHSDERIHRSSNNALAMLEFNSFVVAAGLLAARYTRTRFIWC